MRLIETWMPIGRLRQWHPLSQGAGLAGRRVVRPVVAGVVEAWARCLAVARAMPFKKPLAMVALLGTGVALAGLQLGRSPESMPQYMTEQVKRSTLTRQVTASGPLAPALKAEIGSPVTGTVLEVLADFGSAVEAGDPLARLDTATASLALKEAEIKLAGAQAAADLAQRRTEQMMTLKGEGLVPATDYDRTLSEQRQAEGNVRIADAAVTRARIDLGRCTLRAPIRGMVIARNVSVGQLVETGNGAPPLFVIANDLSRMQIEASVSESDIGGVKPGMEATFTVDAFSGETFEGKVTQVRAVPIVDQTVVSYPVLIASDNGDLRLKPGMTASVSIVIAEREDVLTIPNKALRFRPSGSEKEDQKEGQQASETVYRLRPSGPGEDDGNRDLLERVTVTAGLSDGRRTEVDGGLKEGDSLVVGLASKGGEEGFLARIPALLSGRAPRKKGG